MIEPEWIPFFMACGYMGSCIAGLGLSLSRGLGRRAYYLVAYVLAMVALSHFANQNVVMIAISGLLLVGTFLCGLIIADRIDE